ncbi:Chitinase family protein [Arabidopsis thaliana]|uniref:chitinase n=3 Tax=Arabidopsis thaliana TaxID=3702 RepID=A0A1P8AME8_ARATH|nr:Chitinase family protein [Arabidopsis thaliana]ANM57798.1 Chitinase family protein [Arabidopsis thaliana]|eukprot:NP_001320281.1 Chitinase family protein [Arabidopsis thaliana]
MFHYKYVHKPSSSLHPLPSNIENMATQNKIQKNSLIIFLFTLVVIAQTATSQNCLTIGCPGINECCSHTGYCGTNVEHCGFWCLSGPCQLSKSSSSYRLNDGPRGKIESIVTPALFHRLMRKVGSNCTGKGFYTREAFITAVKSFEGYKGTVAKREIAAILAQFSYESGNFCYKEEVTSETYCSSSKTYPCQSGKKYYGRGLLQSIKWNEFYGEAGKYLGLPLLKDPDMVARSPEVAFKFAMWFWKTEVGPSLRLGFGATTMRINGIECGGMSWNAEAMQNRINQYLEICKWFGVNPGKDLYC